MNNKTTGFKNILVVILLIILAGCSTNESIYRTEGEEIKITNNKQMEHQMNISALSYLTEFYTVEKKSEDSYQIDPSKGLRLEYVLHKDDPDFDEYMDEMDYYVNDRGFDLREKGQTVIVSGQVDEDMQSEFGFDLHEMSEELEIEIVDSNLYLDGEEYSKVSK